jgi:tight adherence protein B
VTAALLSAALAVLLWPDRQAQRARRVALVSRVGGAARGPRVAELPLPVLAAVAAAGVAALVSTALVALVAGLAGLAGARAWVAARRDRAEEARAVGLAEGLGALAAELRSGRTLEQATTAAVAACGNEESGRALARAVRAPGSPARARSAAQARSAGRDDAMATTLDRISAAVVLSSRTGCSLAHVVAAVDEDLRARRRHRQDLRAATAAPRASAMLLAGLPLVGLAMGSGVGADPWRVLTTTGTGQVLLMTGVALEFAGVAWSRRLVERVLR